MKKLLIMLALLVAYQGYAKEKSTLDPNRIYFKLLLLNEKDEVLLVEFSKIWEPIGGEYKSTLSMEDFVRKQAMTANAKVKDIRLRGLFSVYVNKGQQPIVYHYYTARYESGEIKAPDDCTGAKWASVTEAKKIMAYKEMSLIYGKILENDDLLGGSFRMIKNKKKGIRKMETIVDFFKLN